jgi:hypothetical protein
MAASVDDIVRAYGISSQLAGKIVEVSNRLGLPDPAFLANAINFESGYTFSPSKQNTSYWHEKCGGGYATGLIQFIPCTAQSLGTSVEALARMTAEQQMEYVYRYFANVIRQYGPLRSQEDVYMAIFYPKAIGKPDYVFPVSVQMANPGILTPRHYAIKASAKARLWTVARAVSGSDGTKVIAIITAALTAALLITGAVLLRSRQRQGDR